MTTGGQESFEYGDSTIAAKLTVDVEGATALKEINQETERVATQLQAAARAGGDFTKYLQQLPEITKSAAAAQKLLVDQLKEQLDIQNRLSGGAGYSVGQSTTDPFAGKSHGMGASRPAVDPQNAIDQLRNTNPRQWLNNQVARGNLRPGEEPRGGTESDVRDTNERIQRREEVTERQDDDTGSGGTGGGGEPGVPGTGVKGKGAGKGAAGLKAAAGAGGMLGQMMKELGPGGGGMMSALSKVPGLLSKVPGLGAAAAAVGVPLAGLGLVEEGGHMYQGLKNLGGIRGGGAAAGMAEESQILSLGLNPFITNEQARQVIQGALTEGYSGKQYDTVTKMVASNLKEMNMDAKTSFDLLHKSVKEAGGSLSAFGQNMSILKGLAGQGYNSLPQLKENYQQALGQAVSAGEPEPYASQNAMAAANMFRDNPALAGTGPQVTGAYTGQEGTLMAQVLTGQGSPAGALGADLYQAAAGNTEKLSEQALRTTAIKYYNQAGKPPEKLPNGKPNPKFISAVAMWREMNKAMGAAQIDWNNGTYVINLFKELVGITGGPQDPFEKSQQQITEEGSKQLEVKERSGPEQFWNNLTGKFGQGLGEIADMVTGRGTHDFGRREADAAAGAQAYHIDQLDALTEEFGGGSVKVFSDTGQELKLDEGNKGMMDALAQGKYKVQTPEMSSPQTLQQVRMIGAANDLTVKGSATLNITVNQDGKVTAPSKIEVPISGQKSLANAAYGTNQPNNAAG